MMHLHHPMAGTNRPHRGQGPVAALTVRVLDLEGRAIPAASVTVADQEATTDVGGRATLEEVPVVQAVARVDATGFASTAVVTQLAVAAEART